jgi:hypothetical protein
MRWKYAGVSLVGTSHVSRNIPCQDAWNILVLSNGTLIAAVADGLGSASNAEDGAKAACEFSVNYLEQRMRKKTWLRKSTHYFPPRGQDAETVLRDTFAKTREHLHTIADKESLALSDLACTLMVAVVTDKHWYTLHIGDGAIVGVYDKTVKTISPPEQGEYVNVVTPLTSARYLEELRYHHGTDKFTGIALMSDGIEALAISYKTKDAHPGFFIPLMQLMELKETNEVVENLTQQFDTRGREIVDDDMTLVVAYRK